MQNSNNNSRAHSASQLVSGWGVCLAEVPSRTARLGTAFPPGWYPGRWV